MEQLVSYSWPGNIRELRNVIERGVVLSDGPTFRLGHDLAPSTIRGNTRRAEGRHSSPLDAPAAGAETAPSVRVSSPPRLSTLEEVEREHIVAALRESRGVVEGPGGAARILDVHPNTLRSRMKKLGIKRPGHEMS